MSSPAVFVIDAWPVLEWFRQRQPAAERFESFLISYALPGDTLLMSRINYGEVRYKALDYFGPDRLEPLVTVLERRLTLVSVDDDLVNEAALLKHQYKISYADGFAAALAIRHTAKIVTGDPDFLKLQQAGVLGVEWIGA